MTFRRRVRSAGQQGRAAVRQMRELLHLPVICVHEDDEQEPESIGRKPIVSVNGRDVPSEAPDELHHRKSA